MRGLPVAVNYRVNAGIIPLDSWIQDPKSGGGRIIGEVCHFVDTCSFFTGSRPVKVFATSVKSEDKSVPSEDNVSIVISYENGSIANISYYAYGNKKMPKEYIEVFGPGISAQLNDFKKMTIFKNGKKHSVKLLSQDKGFENEFKAFSQAIKTGIPAIPFESIYHTTLVTFKILDSLRTGDPVSI